VISVIYYPDINMPFLLNFESLSNPVVIAVIVGAVTITVLALKHFSTPASQTTKSSDGSEHVDISCSLRKEERYSSKGNLVGNDSVLSASQFREFTVLKTTKLSHNSKLIRFELHPDKTLGLKVGRHITVRAEIDENKVMRSYTPTTRIDQKGYFDLLIKSYEYGKMSTYLTNLQVGQRLQVRGPIGRFQYNINQYPTMGFIAGGTGITPCLQVIRTLLECADFKEDNTKFLLFYQNRTEDDILLYDEILSLQSHNSSRLTCFYFLSCSQSDTWGTSTKSNQYKGYISKDMINKYMNFELCPWVGICGPSGFNDSVKQLLKTTGHSEDNSIFVW